MGSPWRIDPTTHRTMSERSYHGATSRPCLIMETENTHTDTNKLWNNDRMNECLATPQHENRSAIGCQNKVDAWNGNNDRVYVFNTAMMLLHLIGLLPWLIKVKYKSILDCFGTMEKLLNQKSQKCIVSMRNTFTVRQYELAVDDSIHFILIMLVNHLNLLFMYFSTHSGPESCYYC